MVKRRGGHLSGHSPLLTTTPHQREDVSDLNRFKVHRCPTRRVWARTRPATILYLYHSATAAACMMVHQNIFRSLCNDLLSTYARRWIGQGGPVA
ncbi:hypothetical protein TNCV_2949171 [Trichonephila clavipes]|nr:hypothetical protein TNCV_2949171 [Trichonephila clavipes]